MVLLVSVETVMTAACQLLVVVALAQAFLMHGVWPISLSYSLTPRSPSDQMVVPQESRDGATETGVSLASCCLKRVGLAKRSLAQRLYLSHPLHLPIDVLHCVSQRLVPTHFALSFVVSIAL